MRTIINIILIRLRTKKAALQRLSIHFYSYLSMTSVQEAARTMEQYDYQKRSSTPCKTSIMVGFIQIDLSSGPCLP